MRRSGREGRGATAADAGGDAAPERGATGTGTGQPGGGEPDPACCDGRAADHDPGAGGPGESHDVGAATGSNAADVPDQRDVAGADPAAVANPACDAPLCHA